ncbi:MAG TPA: alpha-hydroxy acid oxidase [Vicinamibacterales bacterium]|nr:alpha-hydroxy acid oxidase [Vicinamibacterales bacterium]
MSIDVDCRGVLSLPEFEELARQSMTPMAYEYVASGAAEEHTLRWNREAFDRIRLRPRVLRDVATVDTRVTLLGRELAFPILLAPVAYHRVLHPDGELETARGAAAAGITWVVSMGTTTSIGEIARVATSPLWFQVYFQSDQAFTRDVVCQAEEAGCEALCATVDTPIIGPRNRQVRAGFRLPPGVATPHLYDIGQRKQQILDPRRFVATWKDIDWLRGVTKLPLVLKGILDPDDAELAMQADAQGIVISNHGGRNLDTAPAAIDALIEVADRVQGRVPLLVDGGIRRGTDVLKAIALGASAVLIGRPYCYGLAMAGSVGVTRVVDILHRELQAAMMLAGASRIGSIDESLLWDRTDG